MSWIDNLTDTQFTIVTGDGESYSPFLVQKYIDTLDFNLTQYEYINRQGSLVARRYAKGDQFVLEFAFQGENHIEDGNRFKFSAKDSRSWAVTHPIYGRVIVQPLGLTRDTSALSASFFTVPVVETNLYVQPKPGAAPKKQVQDLKNDFDITVKGQLADIELNDANKTQLKGQINNSKTFAQRIAVAQETVTAINSEVKKVLNDVNNAIATTTAQIRYIQHIVELPAIELSNLSTRLNNMFDAFNRLVGTVQGITNLNQFDKVSYELMSSTYISSIIIATTVVKPTEFKTRKEVANQATKIKDNFELHKATIYSLEDSNYKPNHDIMLKLQELVNVSMFYFSELIFEAKQEREFICKTDTNIIVLAHKLYGIASEENIDYIKQTNNIGLSELFKVSQGRKIIYFV